MTPNRATEGASDRLLSRLRSRRALARLAILFERLWPALWPPLGVAGLFICVALLDVPSVLPPWAHVALLAITGIAVLVLLARGLRGSGATGRRRQATAGWSLPPASGTVRCPC